MRPVVIEAVNRRALAKLRRLPPEAIEVPTMLPIVVRYYRMADGAEHKTDDRALSGL